MMTTTRSPVDPALELFSEWQKARNAASAASDALAALKGHRCTDLDGAFHAREEAALSAENAIIDRLMATKATTAAGALGKAFVLAHLAEQGGDPLVVQFIAAIRPDFDRLLSGVDAGKPNTRKVLTK